MLKMFPRIGMPGGWGIGEVMVCVRIVNEAESKGVGGQKPLSSRKEKTVFKLRNTGLDSILRNNSGSCHTIELTQEYWAPPPKQ